MARSVADDNSELDNLLEEILETEKAAKGKRCVTSKKNGYEGDYNNHRLLLLMGVRRF